MYTCHKTLILGRPIWGRAQWQRALVYHITSFSSRNMWYLWQTGCWSSKATKFSSVQSLSRIRLFVTPKDCSTPGFPVHHQLPESTQTYGHRVSDAIQPSHPLSFPSPPYLQSFPASGSFLMTHFFTSGGQSIGASASTSVLPMNIEDWLPLGLTGLISLQSKGLSRVFSNTAVQKHQFFGTQPSL